MLNPSRDEARRFLIDAWAKFRAREPLSGLEQIAAELIALHLAVAEQLAIDQPPGIRAEFERIKAVRGDEHRALHAVLECLGEVVWTAQRHGKPPDAKLYLGCLERVR